MLTYLQRSFSNLRRSSCSESSFGGV